MELRTSTIELKSHDREFIVQALCKLLTDSSINKLKQVPINKYNMVTLDIHEEELSTIIENLSAETTVYSNKTIGSQAEAILHTLEGYVLQLDV